MKKVLIIAYDFPPARTGGVYRPVKFAKYLPEFGYIPVILTVKNYPKDSIDKTLLDELPPETRIHRAYSFELERIENWVFTKIYRKSSDSPANTEKSKSIDSSSSGSKQSLIKRLIFSPIQRFIENVIHSPDTKIGWIPLAIWAGLKAMRKEKIDIIFSTSPPETNHIIALWLSRLTGKPLVVDFRDPWTTHYTRQNMGKLRTSHEQRMERKILRRAASIIHTGDGRALLVKEAFPEIDSRKHHVITNGYDEADFNDMTLSDTAKPNNSSYFNIVNVGFIYPDTAFSSYLEGLKRILHKPEVADRISSIFVGEQSIQTIEMLSRPLFKDHAKILGFKPHKEAIGQMIKADLLLLLLPKGDDRMSNKIIAGRTFEYLRSGRPILMIGWDGESANMIEKSGLGKFIFYEDIDQIEKTILEYYYRKLNNNLDLRADWNYIKQYDRKTLTNRLAKIFNNSLK